MSFCYQLFCTSTWSSSISSQPCMVTHTQLSWVAFPSSHVGRHQLPAHCKEWDTHRNEMKREKNPQQTGSATGKVKVKALLPGGVSPSCKGRHFPITAWGNTKVAVELSMLSDKPPSRMSFTQRLKNLQHRVLSEHRVLSKHSSFCWHHYHGENTFQLCKSQEQYFNNPHLVFVFCLQQVFFTSELFCKSTFEALFKVKELAAACEYPRGSSCIQSHQVVPRGGRVWRCDHPWLFHKLAENSGENKGSYFYAMRVPPRLPMRFNSSLATTWPRLHLSTSAAMISFRAAHAGSTFCLQCSCSAAAPQTCFGHLQTDNTLAVLTALIIRIFYWLESLLLKLLYNFHFFQPKLRAILFK